jgi:hypothetical protein
MWKWILRGLLIISFRPLCAQLPRGAEHFIATVNSLSRVHNDAVAFTSNPSVLAGLKQGGFSILAERKFLMKEVPDYLLSAALITSSVNAGIAVRQSGFKGYNETFMSLASGRELADRLEAGAEIHFVMISMDGYGKIFVPGFGIGLRFQPTEKLIVGINARDPVSRTYGKSKDEKLPYQYRFGVGFEPSHELLLGFDLVKEATRPVLATATIQYLPQKNLILRGGMSLFNQTFSMGAGWSHLINKTVLVIMVSGSWHFQLGLSPSLQLSLQFPGKTS